MVRDLKRRKRQSGMRRARRRGQTTVFNRVVSKILVGKMRPEQT